MNSEHHILLKVSRDTRRGEFDACGTPDGNKKFLESLSGSPERNKLLIFPFRGVPKGAKSFLKPFRGVPKRANYFFPLFGTPRKEQITYFPLSENSESKKSFQELFSGVSDSMKIRRELSVIFPYIERQFVLPLSILVEFKIAFAELKVRQCGTTALQMPPNTGIM